MPLLRHILATGFVCVLPFLSKSVQADQSDYGRFSMLYSKAETSDDPLARFRQLESLRGEAQGSLERLMKKMGANNTELELRYGELLLARARDMEQFSLEMVLLGKEKEALPLKKEAQRLMRESLARHAKLLQRVPNHPMVPKIYLSMGRMQLGLAQKSQAFELADRGLKALKNTADKNNSEKKGGDTAMQLYILRGDAAFDMAKAGLALESYQKAADLVEKGSLEDAYVAYRTGWVYYNQKDPENALERLDYLIQLSKDKLALRQEAVQDYTLFAADLSPSEFDKRGGIEGAWDHLLKVSDVKAVVKALERMGKVFAKNGRREAATAVYEFIIDKDPLDAGNVDRALTAVEWSHSLADKSKLTSKYLWLLNNFGPKSAWYKKQILKPDVQKLAYDKVEASLRKYAVGLHQDAQKIASLELRQKTEDSVAALYDEHMAAFHEVPRIHFYRAEIHRGRKQWAQAGTHYDSYIHLLELTNKADWEKVDAKMRDEAAWGSIQVWAEAVEADAKNAQSMLASADKFLSDYGAHPKASQVALDAAKVELKAGSKAVALKRMQDLLEKYPKSAQSVEAVHATLDVLNKDSDWVNLALRARNWLNSVEQWAPAAQKIKLHAELTAILAKTEAKACESLSTQKGRELEAALCFESFAKGFGKDPLAPKALLMAAELYDKQNDAPAALAALEILVKQYPNSDVAPQGFSRLAVVYERAFQFEKAADIYESLLGSTQTKEDHEKILIRYLSLQQNLANQPKFLTWLNHKSTPESVRRKFEESRLAQVVSQLRREERLYGYNQDQFVSDKAKQLYKELESARSQKSLALYQELEYRRIKGVMYRNAKKLDKADEEWMSGLKLFWKAKDKNPELWESAARLRLEQGSIWEVVYQNTDLKKNPNRKVELFQKLEAWYTEVLGMKSPVVALDALWMSAKLYTSLAIEMKKVPETAPKAEEFRSRAMEIIRQLAIKAQEWQVLTPVVMASFNTLEKIKAGQNDINIDLSLKEDRALKFPWVELPRWAELNGDVNKWEEWSTKTVALKKVVAAKSAKRSEARRAAFVSLVRENSLKDKSIAAWAQGFNDKGGVQARIQALLNDGDTDRARLFLEQYDNLFKADAFSDHMWGVLEWSTSNYLVAYARWMRSSYGKTDFRTAYWQEGWNKLFHDLTENESSDEKYNRNAFKRLDALAKVSVDKQMVAVLCFDYLNCGQNILSHPDVVQAEVDMPNNWQFKDGRSGWEVKRLALRGYVATRIRLAKSPDDLKVAKEMLSNFDDLDAFAEDRSELKRDYKNLKESLSKKESEIQENQKVVAEVKS